MVYQDNPDASDVRYRDNNDDEAEFGEPIEMPQVVSSSPRRLCSPRCKIVLVVSLLVAAVVVYASKGGDIVGRPLFSGSKEGGVRGSSSDDINVGEYYDIEELSGVDSTATEVVSAPSETTETVSEESAKNDECIDDPTFMINDNKQHTCDTYIAHVGRPQLHKVRCNQSIGEFNKETQAYDIHNSPDEIRDTDLLLKDFCRKSCDICDDMDSNAGDSQQQKPDEMNEPEVVITPESGPSVVSAPSETTEIVSEEPAKNDECRDDPTFMIYDNKQHTCDTYIAHVGRPQLHTVRCNQSIGEFNKETQAYDIHNSPDEIRDTDLLLKDFCRKSCDFCDGMDSIAGDSQQQKPDEMKESEVVITPESGPSTSSEENTPEIQTEPSEGELQQQPTEIEQVVTEPEEDTTPEIPEKIESQQTDTSSISEEEEEEAATPDIPIEQEQQQPEGQIQNEEEEDAVAAQIAELNTWASQLANNTVAAQEDEDVASQTALAEEEIAQSAEYINNNPPPPPPPVAVDVASPPTISSGSSLFGG